MSRPAPLQLSLWFMRISIFIVMLMWTLDKFINPAHSAKVFENFYFLAGLGDSVMAIIGAVELIILAGFVLGLYKRFCYGAVLAFHAVFTHVVIVSAVFIAVRRSSLIVFCRLADVGRVSDALPAARRRSMADAASITYL